MAWNCVCHQTLTPISLCFTYSLGQMLGCDKDDSSLVTGHGGMVSTKYFFISVHCWPCPNYSSTLSLSPDSRLVATCGKFTNFEVQELKSGAVCSMQCQVLSHPAYHVGNLKITSMWVTLLDMQHICTENQWLALRMKTKSMYGTLNAETSC